MPPSAPTATVAAVIRPITLSRLLLKYSAEDFTGGSGRGGGWVGVLDCGSAASSSARAAASGVRSAGVGSAQPGRRQPPRPVRRCIPMADRAWRELERTEVPHTMQNDALVSSRFSHSGQ